MKITNIEVQEYKWKREIPIVDGMLTYPWSGVTFISISTDEGVTGLGLASSGKIVRAAIEELAPLLIGEDPLNTERLWQKMWIPKLMGRRGLTTRAISGIDIGLWDLRGKIAGLPLHKLLGGFRDSVPTYVAGGYYQEGKGLKELAAEMDENVRMGATAVKMKVGALSVREDADRVRVARDAVGPDVKIMIDANCAYRYYDAIRLARQVEDYDVFWFEEPVLPDDYEGHRKVAEATSIPIATGENEYTLFGFRDIIAQEGAAILNPDAKILGGVSEFMKVAALAQAHGLDISSHGTQDIHIHLMAAIPNGLMLEYYRDTHDPLWLHMYKNPLMLNPDGTVTPPDEPGIGVFPNFEVLKEHRVA
ncbi:mandelate racemase/muconate lactonizing enzyme family protein [Acuticoccus sp. M5D2P5]|uniref:mandelate racemase/muconate lactonizing enzyme family protein n=1 Tax=Acuticoccus kalidii TaxID=2910977 RepID=UPI001F319E6A|nr:mandelate racemase/muconate lactonizing enzyme family protein [Acuticoccus kalidii]MCF3935848.1 mandelate racemase/muconate lactonizing enzyme family protein [Acuticoccus kalidii]